MRVKLLTTISFFTYQISISQTEKLLSGKVIDQNFTLKGVEVINKTAQTSTRTNELGEFSILVNPKDSLLFFHKDYFFSRLKVTSENIQNNNLVVKMILKPEELEEVVLTTIKFPKIKYDAEAISKIKMEKANNDLTRFIPGFNNTLSNGLNIGVIGSGLFGLFKREREEPKKEIPKIDFRKLIATTCPEDFFSKDLKLKPEEKELFLQFCDADPQAKVLTEQKNLLYTMDFLYKKNEEFQKLNSGIKN